MSIARIYMKLSIHYIKLENINLDCFIIMKKKLEHKNNCKFLICLSSSTKTFTYVWSSGLVHDTGISFPFFLNKIIDWHFSRLDLLIHDKTTQTVNSYMYIRFNFWQTSNVFKNDRYLMNFKNHFYAIYFSMHAWNLIYSKISCAYLHF